MRKLCWAVIAAAGMAIGAATPASATDNTIKQCGVKYQAAKAGKTLPVGQTWPQSLSQCRSGFTTVAATTVKTSTTTKAQRAPSAAQLAMRTRMKTCSAQWQAEKAAKKLPAGQTWPKYWSQCSAKLEG